MTHSCPACGPFGARKRRRDRTAADQALIRFHTALAEQTRLERATKLMPVWSPADTAELLEAAAQHETVPGWADRGTHVEWRGPAPAFDPRLWGVR